MKSITGRDSTLHPPASPRPSLPASRRPFLPVAGGLRGNTDGDRLAPMLQAASLAELTMLVVRTANELAAATAGFVVLADPATRHLEPASARDERGRPPRSSIVQQVVAGSAIATRLAHGVTVRSAGGEEEGWVVLPLVADSRLQGALAVAVPTASGGARVMEALRDLCRHAAPLVARLRELEELRTLADGLGHLVQEGALCEVRLRDAQDELHQMRAHDALRGQLVAGVNHALRTPLVALRGYARLLLATEGGPEAPARQPLEVISRNADRVVDVAKNLWMPARGSARLARVDLGEIWERVLTVARTVAVGRGLTLVERAPERPVSLVGDGPRLEQMLSRLMEAMMTLAPLGQTLRTELREETARSVVSVEVDELRPESAALDGASGPDMWLDSVREAANRQGGWMTVERGPDAGLKLSIVLPRIEVER